MQSSLFIERPSPVHAWHPLTKSSLALLGLVFAAALTDVTWLLIYFALFQLPLAAYAQIFSNFIRATFLVIWPFTISLAIIQGFFSPGERILFSMGTFNFTLEGLHAGLAVVARLLVALGATLQLMLTTRPDRLMLAFRELGLPNAIAYIVLTALQIIPRFLDRANVILDAQQARGLELQVNLLRRLPLLVPIVSPLILGSIVEVEERAIALETRAFNHPGPRTQLENLSDSTSQKFLRWAILALCLTLIAFRITDLL